MAAYWEYGYYEPTKPIEVKGGIKAKSKRGKFGENWWARRWIEVLESFNIGARLTRGKSYARKGQVMSIKIETGLVKAKVQGSNSRPYSVTIKVRTLTASEWDRLAEEFARKPIFAAKLLAGEMPEDLEAVFEEAGLSLFPEKIGDLDTDCSCPDWSVPCKHIAAVYYLMAEEFDRDPFLIFKLRGVDRDDFLSALGSSAEPGPGMGMGMGTGEEAGPLPVLEEKDEGLSLPSEPLPLNPGIFWGRGFEKTETEIVVEEESSSSLPSPPSFQSEAHIPSVQAALPGRLGKFPFWRGEEDLLEVLEDIYGKASPVGMKVFLGEKLKPEAE